MRRSETIFAARGLERARHFSWERSIRRVREIYGEVLGRREPRRDPVRESRGHSRDSDQGQPRVALVHDWLTGMRGGEKVLEAICEPLPGRPRSTASSTRADRSPPPIERTPVRTSFVQRLPAATRHYRQFLPLFPAAVELFDLDGFDLVISTSHCAVKSVDSPGTGACTSATATPRCATHGISSRRISVRLRSEPTRSRLLRPVMAALARWDRATAGRVDSYRGQLAVCCGADPPIL